MENSKEIEETSFDEDLKQRRFKSGLPAPTKYPNELPAEFELGDGSDPVPPESSDEDEEIQELSDEELKELKDFEELGEKQPAVPKAVPKPAPPKTNPVKK